MKLPDIVAPDHIRKKLMHEEFFETVRTYLTSGIAPLLEKLDKLPCTAGMLIQVLAATTWWDDSSQETSRKLTEWIARVIVSKPNFSLRYALRAWINPHMQSWANHDSWAAAGGIIDKFYSQLSLMKQLELLEKKFARFDQNDENRFQFGVLLNLFIVHVHNYEEPWKEAKCLYVCWQEFPEDLDPKIIEFFLERIRNCIELI